MASASLTVAAYARLAYHALRFPSSPVGGILLGEWAQNKEQKQEKENNASGAASVVVHEVLPVAHSELLPALWEAAMREAEAFADRKFGGRGTTDSEWGIVGVYFANQGLDDNAALSPVAAAVARQVCFAKGGKGERKADGVVFLLDNEDIGALETRMALRLAVPSKKKDPVGFAVSSGSEEQRPGLVHGSGGSVELSSALQQVVMRLGTHLETVRDFEEHMDSPREVAWLPDPADESFTQLFSQDR